MWKVLIADDEPKIRRGLKKSIESLRSDMRVVAEAEDGKAALALVEKEKPDILLVDIRMPRLNGLDLIERIHKTSHDSIIIVVSGHDEFEYARKALTLKVFEYVLKPVSRKNLADVLGRADSELCATRKLSKYISWARDQLERNMPALREHFLRDWVSGRLSDTEIEEQAAFLSVPICRKYGVLVIHVSERYLQTGHSTEKDRKLALFAARSLVSEAFENGAPFSVFIDDNENIVTIADCVDAKAWTDRLERIESRATQSLSHALVMVHKQADSGPLTVAETYETLTAELSRRSSYRSFVLLAQSYIDGHYREPDLNLDKVAAEVQISPGYLSRLLKQETGFTFVDYLTRVRITRAVQLMADPAAKIYEVAEMVGYQSQHYFSRAFKRVFGRPPVEYRKGGS
jgi:two-component system response regulator YesN